MRFWRGYVMHVWQTTTHKGWVAYFLFRAAVANVMTFREAWSRAWRHDLSKYRWDEAVAFAQTIFDLRETEYNSVAYKELLRRLGPSLALHYARNSHHPEHHDGGYAAMGPGDKVEMVCDWAAAVRRHASGNFERSVLSNAKRFGYDGDQALKLGRVGGMIGAV